MDMFDVQDAYVRVETKAETGEAFLRFYKDQESFEKEDPPIVSLRWKAIDDQLVAMHCLTKISGSVYQQVKHASARLN